MAPDRYYLLYVDDPQAGHPLTFSLSYAMAVGLDELMSYSSQLTISPNPVTEGTPLRFDLATSAGVAYTLVDGAGRILVPMQPLPVAGSANSFQVDLSSIAPGTYVLRVVDQQGTPIASGRVVKL